MVKHQTHYITEGIPFAYQCLKCQKKWYTACLKPNEKKKFYCRSCGKTKIITYPHLQKIENMV